LVLRVLRPPIWAEGHARRSRNLDSLDSVVLDYDVYGTARWRTSTINKHGAPHNKSPEWPQSFTAGPVWRWYEAYFPLLRENRGRQENRKHD
jgi:hypothetical protein